MILFFIMALTACVPQPVSTPQPVDTLQPTQTSLPSTLSEAHDTLVNFLTLLHTKNYADAVPLYGGDYEQLQVFNPGIDPNDHVALWTWVCENQLLRCLEVRSATFEHQEGDAYVFQVEFNNPDGSLFVLGPCCGANETEMPPVSQFEYTVTRNAERKFVVMNLPPYVP
ncbi:MAG TPA: hypothetical protein VK206_23925 [Anaerolineales bacterium]|nr:hypothetical protein [Anaerolineales bacterium]